MAEDKNKTATEAEAEEAEGEAAQPKKTRKKLITMAIIAVLFLGGAGASGFFFLTSGNKDGVLTGSGQAEGGAAAPVTAEPARPVQSFFHDLPDITVNLSSAGGPARFLRLRAVLEVGSQLDLAEVQKIQPRIVDDFQVYLRELRPDDLRGSAGAYRLRHDLLLRANQAAQPVHVHNVLFRELIVQ